MNDDLYAHADEAARFLRAFGPVTPRAAVVLGSGLGAFAERVEGLRSVAYAEIPHFPRPTVAGHAGIYIQGQVAGVEVAVLQGRAHHYEGYGFEAVTFSVRVLQRLGVPTLILTASVGGIAPGLGAGDIVAICDHINFLGSNPLRGPNDGRLGTRFLDLSEVYSRRLLKVARDAAASQGLPLATGIYAAMPGPTYETPAEVRMLGRLGADVVGMSTVPEAIVARHAGMEVLGLAVVANAAAGLSPTPLSHAEVLEHATRSGPALAGLLAAIVGRID